MLSNKWVNLYHRYTAGDHLDNFRAVCELLFLVVTFHSIFVESREMWTCFQKTRSVAGYFHSAWNYIDCLQIALSVVCISLWWGGCTVECS